MIDAIDQVKQFDKTGKLIRKLPFPEKVILPVLEGRKKKKIFTILSVTISLRELPINLM